MPHRLTHVLVLAALATTAWHGPAFADQWWGSASCTANTNKAPDSTGKHGYQNTETHTWTIAIPQTGLLSGTYDENWTVTGHGADDLNSWVTSGAGPKPGSLRFFVSPTDGLLHILRTSSQQTDPQGISVTPKSGGNTFHASVGEILFPVIPPADPNSKSVVGNDSSTSPPDPPPGSFYLEPTGSTVVTTCSWNFQYGTPPLVKPPPGTVLHIPPGGLKLEEDKPTGIRPPASLSIFFGGPGGGSVTAALFSVARVICFSDCIQGDFGPQGSPVTLTAAPDATSVFAGWGGSCSGTSPTCSVTLGASNSAIAYFRSKFKSVAAGAYHTCALRPAGDVVCWGRNFEGQIGTGVFTAWDKPLPPSPVIGITNAVAIAAGGYHTCALLADGTVSCWGKDQNGEIGDGSRFGASNATPTTVSGISEALAVTAGGAHTCVVLAGGPASCWGLNRDGQLGASTIYDQSFTPVTVGTVGPLTKQIAAGGFHTCAIAADSTVACWGRNSDGQAGNPRVLMCESGLPCVSTGDITTSLNNVTTIAASIGVGQLLGGGPLGGYHTVALDSSGTDWGWGNNNDGQLPDTAGGAFAVKDSSPPVPVPVKIAAGAYHTCILDSTMGVFCRGNNKDKQSGPTPPGIVPMTASAVDVAAGGYHTCAVIVNPPSTPADGSVECWGLNYNGEVDGTPLGSDVATPEVLSVP